MPLNGEVFFNSIIYRRMEDGKKYGWFDGWLDSGIIIAGAFALRRLVKALFRKGE